MEIIQKQGQITQPVQQQTNLKMKKKETKIRDIYSRCLITRNISVPIVFVNKNIREKIEHHISNQFEGKCINEGYVKPGSSKIITYSSGIIERGVHVLFEVLFECLVCFPVEGALLSCVAKNVTKAGIRAESADETPSPVVIFVARDHNYVNPYFSTIQEGDNFVCRVIGQRFELNDKYISIIAELVKPKVGGEQEWIKKPKLIIEEE
jgi:DNA-directed RNA polymerase subunit E'/Rpb7